MPKRPYLLSCHCKRVRFEVDAELGELLDCNCSTCARHGFLHWKVDIGAVRMLTRRRGLTVYHLRDLHGGHHFCPNCGVGVVRTGYLDGRISVNSAVLA